MERRARRHVASGAPARARDLRRPPLSVVYRYPERHRVKPGITGWAQVNGLRGWTSLEDRVEWDNYYVENWSLGLDVAILVRTVGSVLGAQGDPGHKVKASSKQVKERQARRGSLRAAQRMLGLFVLMMILWATTATAEAAPGAGGPSAADQYVEDIPTATGSQPAGSGDQGGRDRGQFSGGGGGSGGRAAACGRWRLGGSGGSSGSGGSGGSGGSSVAPLSAKAQDALDGLSGPSAEKLKQVATSGGLGAPPRSRSTPPVSQAEPSIAGAVLAGARGDDGSSSVLMWLLIAMAATTIVVLAPPAMSVASTAAQEPSERSAGAPAPDRARDGRALRAAVIVVAVAAGTFLLALRGGFYDLVDRDALTIFVWWAVGLIAALGVWRIARAPVAAIVALTLLIALAVLTGLRRCGRRLPRRPRRSPAGSPSTSAYSSSH